MSARFVCGGFYLLSSNLLHNWILVLFLSERKFPRPVGTAKERGEESVVWCIWTSQKNNVNLSSFPFFSAVITKGEWSRKQTKTGKCTQKKSCREKLEEAINSWRASSSVLVSKPFLLFFFYRSFFLFSIHIHRILWSCKDRCKWSGLCKPTHLIDADAINKSTRIPPLTFSFRSTPGIPHSCGSSPNSHPSCFLLKVLEQSEIAQHSTAADCVFFLFSIGIP
jgi:hypothetical protein